VILSQGAKTGKSLPKLAKQSDAYINGNRSMSTTGLKPRKEVERVHKEHQVQKLTKNLGSGSAFQHKCKDKQTVAVTTGQNANSSDSSPKPNNESLNALCAQHKALGKLLAGSMVNARIEEVVKKEDFLVGTL
jgi:hypothetical protein